MIKKMLSVYYATSFYTFALLLFFLDICFSTFFEKHIIFSLLCFYSLTIFKRHSLFQLSFLFILLSLATFFQQGHFDLQFFYLIPLTIIALKIKRTLYTTKTQSCLFLILALLLHALLTKQAYHFMPLLPSYTLATIFVNIIIVLIISLTY